ncbi:hypothetical protein MHH81_09015 [Psychrobacillus sp. FSL H8-0484]|uniref:hypothetical protein n=1 Tax=Psychrobacillus sp. FSL H8-0484 TaxID=2921390 RepID=UPI0030FBE516
MKSFMDIFQDLVRIPHFGDYFFMYDGSDGKTYCGGDYPLNITDMENFLNIFSMFSNQKRKNIVNIVLNVHKYLQNKKQAA